MKVAVAVSGGVDSAVAAVLLQEQGYDVSGVMLRLRAPSAGVVADEERARALCERLGVGFTLFDEQERFERLVVEPFVEAYLAGRTPNPCVTCNEEVKLGLLLDRVVERGFERLATGHYARLGRSPEGEPVLLRGADGSKEQSYFLARVPGERLARVLFPLGEWSKPEVREKAAAAGLDMVPRTESQEVCFVGYEGAGAEVAARAGSRAAAPGDIVDEAGRALGRHRGLHFYTVGQRRGLGVPAAHSLYVLALDVEGNRLVVGPRDACLFNVVHAGDVVWSGDGAPGERFEAVVQVRYRHRGCRADIQVEGDTVVARLREPAQGVAPGQSLVMYDGDRVLGAAWIERAER